MIVLNDYISSFSAPNMSLTLSHSNVRFNGFNIFPACSNLLSFSTTLFPFVLSCLQFYCRPINDVGGLSSILSARLGVHCGAVRGRYGRVSERRAYNVRSHTNAFYSLWRAIKCVSVSAARHASPLASFLRKPKGRRTVRNKTETKHRNSLN